MRSTAPISRISSAAVSSLRGLSSWSPSSVLGRTVRSRSVSDVAGDASRSVGHAVRSLELHRDLADLVVLAQRVADPVLRHQDPAQVGVPVEGDAEHVEHLALHRLGAGMEVEQRRQRRRRTRAPAPAAGSGAAALMSSRLTTTSKRSAATPSGSGRPMKLEVVDAGEVDAHRVAVVGERLDERRRTASRVGWTTSWPQRLGERAAVQLGRLGVRRRRRSSASVGRRRLMPTCSRAAPASPWRRSPRRGRWRRRRSRRGAS